MLELDPRTTILVNAIYSFFTVGFLFFFSRFSSEKKKALWSWTIAFLLISLNFFIIPLRGLLPTLFIVIAPHIGVFLAYSLIKKGVCSFWEIPNHIYRDAILFIIYVSLLIYFRDNTQARVLTVTLVPSLLILDTIFHILTHRKSFKNSRTISTILFISFGIQMIRFYLGLHWPKVKDPLVLGNNLSAISILFFLSTMSTFFCLLYIYFEDLLQERNKLVSKLKVASQTDELTQLKNRRAFHETLTYEIKKTHRTTNSFALAIADIDFFKNVNDTFGHQCGDDVLRIVSKELKKNIR
ncbi:GGDEF domain-containing protein, partial [bacterium]|nr:GGDEF domain-containing protein [bacterium]